MTETQTVFLSRGAHAPDGQFCVMEHISVRAGLPWTDRPSCTHHVLTSAAIRVNDWLPDGPRQQLLALEDDLMACPPRADLEPGLSVALAIWSAEQVLPIWEARYPEDQRPRKAIEAAKARPAAASAAYAAASAYADASAASVAAAYAAYAASAYAAAAYAADAAASAASAASAYAAYAAAAYADAADAAADAAASAASAASAYAAYAARSTAADTPKPVDLLQGLIGQYRELSAAAAKRSEPAATPEGAHS